MTKRAVRERYPRRKNNQKREAIEFLEKGLSRNGKAIEEGPRKKKWTVHDLRSIRPLTPAQEDMFRAFFDGRQICAYGTAGTGKSYVAIWLALNELLREGASQNRLILVRSAVATRDQGYLPGTLEEKEAPYERPYRDIFADIVGKTTTYDDMKAAGLVEFNTTSNVRGITWNNAIVLIDEIQNCNFQEINSVMTRIGKNTRVMAMGDIAQNDLNKRKNDETGMNRFLEIAKRMRQFEMIKFQWHDIVRSEFVKSWIIACEEIVDF